MTNSPLRLFNSFLFNVVRHAHLLKYKIIQNKLLKEKGNCKFQCNICGQNVSASLVDVCDREMPSCSSCGSNQRYRSIIHVLSLELFGESISLPEFPVKKNVNGFGMSDWEGYSDVLAEKLSYTNTFYHKEPKLDITKVPREFAKYCDFVISSDVFEHILPPVNVGFQNIRKLLRHNGFCVFTVPFMHYFHTWEHFPALHDFVVSNDENGASTLLNMTIQGEKQRYDDLVFHGGDGATLEMRIFSRSALLREFKSAGFVDVKVHQCHKPEYGIMWPITWSLPISARVK